MRQKLAVVKSQKERCPTAMHAIHACIARARWPSHQPCRRPRRVAAGGAERPVLDLLEQALRHHASLVGVVARSRGSHAERLGPILLRRHRVGAAELHARHQARVEAVQRVL